MRLQVICSALSEWATTDHSVGGAIRCQGCRPGGSSDLASGVRHDGVQARRLTPTADQVPGRAGTEPPKSTSATTSPNAALSIPRQPRATRLGERPWTFVAVGLYTQVCPSAGFLRRRAAHPPNARLAQAHPPAFLARRSAMVAGVT
jgi:hypothetical protein